MLISSLCWGLTYIWYKIVYKYYDPITTVFLRLVISTVILFIIIKILKKQQKINPKDYKLFLLAAFFEPFCYFLGESFGLKYVSPTVGAVIIATIPVFTPLLAYFTLKEKLSGLNIFGLLISFLGVVIILLDKNFSIRVSLTGVALLFFAVLSALLYSVAIKKLSHRYSGITIVTTQNIIASVYFLPLFLIFDFNQFIQVVPNFELISNLLCLAVFGSAFAFVLYIAVVKELGVSKANILANLVPVFTAVFSYFILSEMFNLNKILGIIIVLTGVILSQLNKFRRKTK